MIDDARLAALFDGIAARGEAALAVSGGPDSMALLHLADRWRRRRLAQHLSAPDFIVLTVDHGLRPEAADECRLAMAAAEKLGYRSQRLAWQGERPTAGLQEWAREIRYQLLAIACHAHGIGVLITAHHLDDQAETLLMRLARGSGVDGLAAMAQESRRLGLTLLRPLLDVPKRELVAELERHGIAYARDPSNADPRYERARLRQRDSELKRLGLSAEMIGLSARRLRQARQALEETRDRFLAANAQVSPYGSARIDQLALADVPFEITVRALARVLRICGGGREAPNLARLETLAENLRADFDTGRTLAGCRLIAKAEHWLVVREASRIADVGKRLLPGQCVFWDNRYVVCLDAAAPDDILAGPLGRAVDIDKALDQAPVRTVPREALASLLTLRRRGEIVAVPALDIWNDEAIAAGLTARFIGGDESVG